MKNLVEFLSDLQLNNNKEWFDANKSRYKLINEEFNSFVEKLIKGISTFDIAIADLTVKDCTYRIYRDVRFSSDKTPYKTHMGAYFCQGGKKSGYAGYYFHIEPKGNGFIRSNMLSSGLYIPEPKILKSVREEISDNGKQFEEAIKKADGFKLNTENKLKRLPTGFKEENIYAEYLRLKNIYLEKFVLDDFLFSKDLVENVVTEFKKTYDFIKQINRAVRFAHEEM